MSGSHSGSFLMLTSFLFLFVVGITGHNESDINTLNELKDSSELAFFKYFFQGPPGKDGRDGRDGRDGHDGAPAPACSSVDSRGMQGPQEHRNMFSDQHSQIQSDIDMVSLKTNTDSARPPAA
ncbi:uncharacterized protein [Amphiura filiformis]|uniref:uncharacterized protein n=1 Tax=Amphiura filiformis TaxID=82378 RepID=UPI003B218DFC